MTEVFAFVENSSVHHTGIRVGTDRFIDFDPKTTGVKHAAVLTQRSVNVLYEEKIGAADVLDLELAHCLATICMRPYSLWENNCRNHVARVARGVEHVGGGWVDWDAVKRVLDLAIEANCIRIPLTPWLAPLLQPLRRSCVDFEKSMDISHDSMVCYGLGNWDWANTSASKGSKCTPVPEHLSAGRRVAIRSCVRNKYLQAVKEGGGSVSANADTPLDWETFVVHRDGDQIGFQTCSGRHFLSARGNGKLTATATHLQGWEKFKYFYHQGTPLRFGLRTAHGTFLGGSPTSDQISHSSGWLDGWEFFEMVLL